MAVASINCGTGLRWRSGSRRQYHKMGRMSRGRGLCLNEFFRIWEDGFRFFTANGATSFF